MIMYDYSTDLFNAADIVSFPPETAISSSAQPPMSLSPYHHLPIPPPPLSYDHDHLPNNSWLTAADDVEYSPSPQSVQEALVALKSEVGGYNSTSCSSYGSSNSLPGYANHSRSSNCFVQRSFSSNSISVQKDDRVVANRLFVNPILSYLDEAHPEVWDSDPTNYCSMRKVLSTGDLQRVNLVQRGALNESSIMHDNYGVDAMDKVGRYSAEERKERIERYKSKRHQRNFHKKIKYACRKTLADSRPRIRGRFARNDEIEENISQSQRYQMSKYENEEDGDVWLNFIDAFSVNMIP
ncbi:hypothetical protein Scep_004580 [Stephania cephalantha]|uniref:CCT domain-containing protein n=1 Tax=Stephania cephalantha TaxID=152367 RepID=A0AAP0PZ88_9MAGN